MSVDTPVIAPVAFDLTGASAACGLSVRELQTAIKDGDLIAHYRGVKPLIERDELRDFIRSLPTQRRTA